MAKFITGDALENAICDVIWKAEETLMIVSPFIKLDEYFRKLFKNHVNNPRLHILVIFGKNESNVSKSLNQSDFDFFKQFPNVTISYVPQLHAKYYGNEKTGIITSINLYDYSFKNNVEFGVLSEIKLMQLSRTADTEAWNTCFDMAEANEAVFIKRPVYEKRMLSALLGKNYIKSDVLLDHTEKFYKSWGNKSDKSIKTLKDFPSELELGSDSGARPTRDEVAAQQPDMGFCIRTGERIPFNPKRPLCESAYRSWSQFGNPDYPEKYCHKTGKPSNGKTSVRNPVLG